MNTYWSVFITNEMQYDFASEKEAILFKERVEATTDYAVLIQKKPLFSDDDSAYSAFKEKEYFLSKLKLL